MPQVTRPPAHLRQLERREFLGLNALLGLLALSLALGRLFYGILRSVGRDHLLPGVV